ncbi:TetR/AcrR family transcriptional regulator [Microbacterium sp. KUDC0406]|uniref:TetR/AcrR family transcriptional regulator n=1 Tax=Microbacterium sp. KUDC0406 TaxID=2909588 RepID=UPI001F45E138|nr:TetR/AcrR family transcriptional regulator [Microbacterium sp. KUDC0406]UJP09051.1 TetR/AcrR family transcriptional regulator [Microbacterium sp. KUDC0406]
MSQTRAYHSPVRAEQAERTRAAIVEAARELLIAEGFPGATVQRIAAQAGVNVDTIYRSIGRKGDVVRAVVESAISGTPQAIPAPQRDYVQRIVAAGTAGEKIDIYAAAITRILSRLAPVFAALRDASRVDVPSRELWQGISERRARNMRDFAADLRATGELRDDLDDEAIADVIWSMNSPEYWILLVEERGWAPDRFRAHLADAWRRMLLR